MQKNVDSLSKFISVVELNRIIEYLLDTTIMPHERSPRGYTDPDMKHFMEGKRDILKRIQSYINR